MKKSRVLRLLWKAFVIKSKIEMKFENLIGGEFIESRCRRIKKRHSKNL